LSQPARPPGTCLAIQGNTVTSSAAGDIEDFTLSTTFQIMQSLRLDREIGVSRPA
jgi:hypothetical protein